MRFMGTAVDVAEVTETAVETLPDGRLIAVRTYQPLAPRSATTVVYVHGGGWCVGDLEQADRPARRVCASSGMTVVSVGYRLAPEHPFPAAVDDVEAVVRRCTHGGRLVLMGESAGATIALSVALAGVADLAGLVLVYPCVDADLITAAASPYARGYWLTLDDMRANWSAYLSDGDERLRTAASPAHAPSVAGLPPALIVTAGVDLLRAEALAFAKRLRKAGVATRTIDYPGVVHGFWEFDAAFPEATEATTAIAEWLHEQVP
jgi:acetyl esterase